MLKIEIVAQSTVEFEHCLQMLGLVRANPFAGAAIMPASPGAKLADEIKAGAAFFVSPTDPIARNPTEQTARDQAMGAFVDEVTAMENPSDLAPKASVTMTGNRKYGQPGGGRKRRTKAELEEDLAYARANPDGPPIEANISTGGERVDPDVAAQDEVDEAAETASNQNDKLTRENVRAAVKRYIDKFGVPASIANMGTIIGSEIDAIPDTQEALGSAIAKIDLAISGSTVLTPAAEPVKVADPVAATKAELIDALKAYGRRYDGNDSGDPAQMPHTSEDLPKVFRSVFGDNVVGLATMQQTPENFGRIVPAIRQAIEKNPFGRTPK